MKKILIFTVLAAMLLSVSACSEDKPDFTVAQTTADTEAPEVKPTPVTIDEVNGVISSVKEEYANSSEITLSDGTVISATVKNPGITAESVSSGEATMEQMTAFATYMANIRKIVCDRLISYFPEDNRIYFDESSELDAEFLFLDPASDGFDTTGDAFAEMLNEENDDDVVTDYIVIQDSMAVLLDADTNASSVLCPSEEENTILIAILERVDPDAIAEQTTESAE